MTVMDPRRDATDPPPPSHADDPDDEFKSLTLKEAMWRVDTRSLEVMSALGRLTGEVGTFSKKMGDSDRRFERLETKIDKIERNEEKRHRRDVLLAADIRSIKDALARDGRKVAPNLEVGTKDFTDDVEDSRRFVLALKAERKTRNRIILAAIIGAATALGGMLAGTIWQGLTHHAAPTHEAPER